jgi:hypothetical protein
MIQTNNNHFAEVIESSLHNFKAQAWQWDAPPAFGSLVTIQDGQKTIFALVYQIETGSMDPIHYPFAYKKTHEELLKEQPQIFEFLKTTFSGLIVGYRSHGRIHYLMPSEPPKIHAFISTASSELAKEFFSNPAYLNLIFGCSQHVTALDELLLATLKQQASLDILSSELLQEFTETFSLLSGNDYRRLKLFLKRAQPLFEYK